MPLCSMTGFTRADGAGEGYRWTWEVRSVNGKGLDIRLRLPPGFDAIEPAARERIGAHIVRGSVQASLAAQHDAGVARVRINEDVLAQVLAAMERVGQQIAAAPPTLDGILAIRGVVETVDSEPDEATRAALAADVVAGLDRALVDLIAVRAREGAAIVSVLVQRLDELERLVQVAEASPARSPEAIRARLAEQVADLIGAAPSLAPDRLHQEAVLLATRADIREEIDRLHAHIAAARDLLAGDTAVGRRLDFLAQEFNREVNTLCSKSNDRALTATGLEMKAVVDQLREQVQNLE
jgi:uncharacterized protein (TIGR00255 family)